MSHFLKVFIAVSVLLNLLLAGIIIGDIGRYFVAPNKQVAIHELAGALSADKRERVKGTVSHADQELSALRQRLDNARKKTLDSLRAEPFDKMAYLAQVDEIHRLKDQIRQCMAGTIVILATQADQQERAKMAKILFPQN